MPTDLQIDAKPKRVRQHKDGHLSNGNSTKSSDAPEISSHRAKSPVPQLVFLGCLFGSLIVPVGKLVISALAALWAVEDRHLELQANTGATSATITAMVLGGPSRIEIAVKNFGKTDSYDTEIEITTWNSESVEPQAIPSDAVTRSTTVPQMRLIAGEEIKVSCKVGQPPRSELRGRKAIVHARGVIHFKDTFGAAHKSPPFYFIWDGNRRSSMTMTRASHEESGDWQ